MVNIMNIFRVIGMSMLIAAAYAKNTVVMKALVLTTASSESDYITKNFQSYGIPFDIIKLSKSNLISGNLSLYGSNNEPKYNLIVINGGKLQYESNGSWVSALTEKQWASLEEYEAANSVRRVVIEEEPIGSDQYQLENLSKYGDTIKKQPLIVENSSEVSNIFKAAGVKTSAPLNVDNIYHSRVKILDTEHTKPLLYYSDNGSKGAVASTITTYPNGREVLRFFFGFGSWSQSSLVLNHIWLTWGTRSLFNGFRRVYFTPHIDDVFLSTELVDVDNELEYSPQSIEFRTSKVDFEHIIKFQKEILKDMPAGSFFRSELAFNGNGILLAVNYDDAVEVDGERYVDLEFVKKPGTGEKRWPKANYKLSASQIDKIKGEPLFKYFQNNPTAQKEFFWSSHTFSHENLDNASKSDVDNEIRLNIQIAEMLGLTDKEWFSSHSIITPQISGIHNKDALDVFEQYGIQSATGDLSRPAITNTENPYLPYFTTMESSNKAGFPVIPRTPTEIYYFCSNRTEDIWMNNHMYSRKSSEKLTWDQLAENEAKRTLLLMLTLRHEAHQFHQANLRYYKKEGKYGESLLEDWTRAVVGAYTKFVDWPLISIKIDRQAEVFLERAELEKCGHESRLVIENGKVTGISVKATKGSCTVPITIPSNVKTSSLPSGAKTEQIGNDPLTVWVPLKKGETKTIGLKQSLNWKVSGTPSNTSTSTAPINSAVPTTTTTTVSSTIGNKPTATVNGRCGAEFGGACKDANQCCSKYNYCGVSDAHCGNGCQSEFGRCNNTKKATTTTTTKKTTTTSSKKATATVNGRCGKQFGGACKNANECCSQYNYCGTSEAHCGKGCQSEFGKCNNTSKATTTTKKTTTTSKKASKTTSSKKATATVNGRCGKQYGGACKNANECCSQYNYCGTSEAHCGKGCQSEFGKCNNTSKATKTTVKTSSTKKRATATVEGRCGKQYGGACKNANHCCSQYNYCGVSDAHCGKGCQSEFGKCK